MTLGQVTATEPHFIQTIIIFSSSPIGLCLWGAVNSCQILPRRKSLVVCDTVVKKTGRPGRCQCLSILRREFWQVSHLIPCAEPHPVYEQDVCLPR